MAAPAGDHRAALQARIDDIAGPDCTPAERALVIRLLTNYVTKTPPGLDALEAALGTGDAARVRDQAHALKGSAANIGAVALTETFGAIEEEARAGKLDGAAAALERAHALFAETAPLCTRLATELAPDPSF